MATITKFSINVPHTLGGRIKDLTFNPKYWTHILVKGTNILYSSRNYYYDRKVNRIRYENMTVGQASYDHIYNVYVEVSDGFYMCAGTATACADGKRATMVDKATAIIDHMVGANPEKIQKYKDSLIA